MCRDLWGFELYSVKVYGQCREQWKGSLHDQRLSRAAIFSQLQLTPAQPAIDKPASLISGWKKPPQPYGNGTLLKGRSRVDIPLMCSDDRSMAVLAWITVACILVNTWLQIPVSLEGDIHLGIQVTPGRTLNIMKLETIGPFGATPVMWAGISFGFHPISELVANVVSYLSEHHQASWCCISFAYSMCHKHDIPATFAVSRENAFIVWDFYLGPWTLGVKYHAS